MEWITQIHLGLTAGPMLCNGPSEDLKKEGCSLYVQRTRNYTKSGHMGGDRLINKDTEVSFFSGGKNKRKLIDPPSFIFITESFEGAHFTIYKALSFMIGHYWSAGTNSLRFPHHKATKVAPNHDNLVNATQGNLG